MSVSYHIRGVSLDSDTGTITVSAVIGDGCALEGAKVQLSFRRNMLPDHIRYQANETMLFHEIPKFIKEELNK